MHLPAKIAAATKQHANQTVRSFYLYDTTPMRAKIAHLKAIMPKGVQIFYAMKANPHPAFLKTARDAGVTGIEIASFGEGKKAVAAGFSPSQLIFTGPGKSPEELEWSLTNGIHAIHIESLTEAHRLSQLCAKLGKTQDILLRVNPDFDIHGAQSKFSGGPQKQGVDDIKLHDILPQILALPHLNFRGLHVYAASGVLSVDDLLKNCRLVFDMAREVEKRMPSVTCGTIDFGGGFGIDYLETGHDFSPETYVAGLTKLIAEYGFGDRQFVLELGRYLTADSGWYCTEILDIKDSYGSKQVICAGGAHHFRRPTALSINHPVMIVPMQRPSVFAGQESALREKIFIGGALCNTADRLGRDIYVEAAHIGDYVIVGLAGAYGLTMSHINFLSHPHPPEIVL